MPARHRLTLFLLLCAACGDDASIPDGGETDAGETDAGVFVPPTPGVALTPGGEIRGVLEGDVYVYRGIPYAAPPVGPLRFRPPEPPAPLPSPYVASDFGPDCLQAEPSGVAGDEDCLTLNVWAPATVASAPRPVHLHIHGGDNLVGSGSLAVLDGRHLVAASDVIYVTFNYRLGSLGFLAHPSLAAESEHGTSGNYGLLDQIAALRWVRDNIAAFGGDPNAVIISGYSAGASNVCAMMVSPLAAGLFHRAILQSGPCTAFTDAKVARTAELALEALGCTGAADIPACLRARPADQVVLVPGGSLYALHREADFYISVDGRVITEPPMAALAAGRHNHVAAIFGTTRDEYASIIELIVRDPPADDAAYRAELARLFGEANVAVLAAEYPPAEYGSPLLAIIAILNDANMHCSTRRALRAMAGSQSEPLYRYLFAAESGAGHSDDVKFVFGTFEGTPSASDRALSDAIIGYFGRFTVAGDPNGGGAEPWPRYGPAADSYLLLADPLATGAGFRAEQCDFWDARIAAAE